MTVVKYSSSGNRIWVSSFDTAGLFTVPTAMVLNGGSIEVTGFSYDSISGVSYFSTASFDEGTGYLSAVKMVANGSGLISRPIGIQTDVNKNTYIAGTSTVAGIASVIKIIAYDSAFNQLWVSTWGDSTQPNIASAMTETAPLPGNALLLTGTSVNASGVASLVVMAYGFDGSYYGSLPLGGADSALPSGGTDITFDNDYFYVTGWTKTGADTAIVTAAYQLSSATEMWQKNYSYAPNTNNLPYNINVSADGSSVYVTGRSFGADSAYFLLSYDQWMPTPCDSASITSCPAITYQLENQKVTMSGGTSYVEFDLYASQTNPSLAYTGGDVILTFSKSTFDTATTTTSPVTITRGQIIGDSSAYRIYMTDTLLNSDIVPADGKEIWLSFTAIDTPYFTIADTFQKLAHIKIKRKHPGPSEINFDQYEMENNSFFREGDENVPYTYVYTVGSLRSSGDSINFSIANASLSGGTYPTLLDFDIVGTAYTYAPLGDYSVVVNYNSAALSLDTIIDSLSLGSDSLGDALYFFITTPSPGSVIISLTADGAYFDALDTSQIFDFINGPTILAHVRLNINNCDQLPGVAVIASPYTYGDYVSDTASLLLIPYNPPVGIGPGYNNFGVHMCIYPPYAEIWTPGCTNAGSFEVMTINGLYFGTDTGTVYFSKVDSPGIFIHTLPQDIRLWTDNEIQLLIPSDPSGVGIAGSGQFYIQTALGYTNIGDNTNVSIGYANLNVRNGSTGSPDYMTAEFVYLRDTPFVFQLDSALFYTHDALNTAADEAHEINCRTGVNFVVQTTGPAATNTPNANDHINLISIQSYSTRIFSSPTTLAKTDLSGRILSCYNNGLPAYNNWARYLNEVDISIIDTPAIGTWQWSDTTPALGTQVDFGSVLAHEFGHAALLLHTQPQNGHNVMYGSITPGENLRLYNFDADDVLGIMHMQALGAVLGAAGGCPADTPFYYQADCPTAYPAPSCVQRISTTSGIIDIPNSTAAFDAVLYPNPYEGSSVVHIDVSHYDQFTVAIYDIVGHLISQTKIPSAVSFDVPLSAFDFSDGLYLILVSDSNNRKTLKMVKL